MGLLPSHGSRVPKNKICNCLINAVVLKKNVSKYLPNLKMSLKKIKVVVVLPIASIAGNY